MQPSIVRIYKLAGLVALTAILVGLIGFLVVNIFYFFDNTWVRPVVLSPTHQKVVEASTLLGDAKLRAAQLETEKLEIEANLAEIDRLVIVNEKFLADVGVAVDVPARTAEQWLVYRELSKARLERDNAVGKRAPLKQRLESMGARIKDQNQMVNRLAGSPYLRAIDHKVVLAFVPYSNLKNVKKDTKLYGCSWGLVACSRAGKITTILEGEVQDIHPHDESVQRGVMVEVEVVEGSANDIVLFAGGKPLWLF
ncbi:MAG: hypothetical protein H0T79_01570 [Deltaproteobacteria bacterium]|nr:hypothetical protein [Deltaproteobacteria bacterium]